MAGYLHLTAEIDFDLVWKGWEIDLSINLHAGN
jgi:hypothetical protein